jgi:hypothetical protein
MSAPAKFRPCRRRGVVGRVGFLRGVVIDENGGYAVMRTRSPGLAEVVTRILNGEDLEPRSVVARSPLTRYHVAHDLRSEDRRLIVAVESTARRPSAFGDGILATTDDPVLAERVSKALNKIDPLPRARVMRGMGWW